MGEWVSGGTFDGSTRRESRVPRDSCEHAHFAFASHVFRTARSVVLASRAWQHTHSLFIYIFNFNRR